MSMADSQLPSTIDVPNTASVGLNIMRKPHAICSGTTQSTFPIQAHHLTCEPFLR